jgi:hypothetical protein
MRYASSKHKMNKTVYLRDDEVPVWEKARELSGDKLSPVIVAALKEYIDKTEAEKRGFERIVIGFRDSEDNGLQKKKAFFGRWIIPPGDKWHAVDDDGSSSYPNVAETAKGNLVIHEREFRFDGAGDEYTIERFGVFESFSEMAANNSFRYAAYEANKRRGVPIEELDI